MAEVACWGLLIMCGLYWRKRSSRINNYNCCVQFYLFEFTHMIYIVRESWLFWLSSFLFSSGDLTFPKKKCGSGFRWLSVQQFPDGGLPVPSAAGQSTDSHGEPKLTRNPRASVCSFSSFIVKKQLFIQTDLKANFKIYNT